MFDNTAGRFSYTALDTFNNCPLCYYYKYEEHKRTVDSGIATSIGSILHKGRELVSDALIKGETPDLDAIKNSVMDGWKGADKMSGKPEEIMGIKEIQSLFWEDWMFPEEGIPSYDERLQIYFDHLGDDIERMDEWHPVAAEVPFNYLYGGSELFGVIDKIEENSEGQLRIVDYKSSKKVYNEKKLTSPLQLYVYLLAVQKMYPGKEIEGCWYDFIMLGEQRRGGTKGWEKRCEKKLSNLIGTIADNQVTGIWKPKPSPLCYWCSYCANNPLASEETNNLCSYYSLWTPNTKTFEVANEWKEGTVAREEAKKKVAFVF